MGLDIGDNGINSISINCKGGFVTTEAYVHIAEYYKPKDRDVVQVSVKIFKSKADRDANKGAVEDADGKIKNLIDLPATVGELAANDIYTVAYAKLKADLNTAVGIGSPAAGVADNV